MKKKLLIGFLIRILFLIIGILIDSFDNNVKYTDIDYKVFTEGANYVTKGLSPYKRHTYRYTPILAYLMIPNIKLNIFYGKILFIIIDILVGYIIYLILNKKNENNNNNKLKIGKAVNFWLYNPIIINCSTRGSSDCINSLLILLVFYLIKKEKNYFLTGILFGFTIHFKFYAIIYSLIFYLYIASKDSKFNFFNLNSIKFAIGCIIFWVFINLLFYKIYGYEYLYESFIYHFIRKDHRHNYSIFFMFIYLFYENINKMLSIIILLQTAILLFFYSIKFLKKPKVGLFILTYFFVMLNKVITFQYYVWIVQFLPFIYYKYPILFDYNTVSGKKFLQKIIIWGISKLIWGYFANLFENNGKNHLLQIHFSNIFIFIINSWIIIDILKIIKFYNSKIKKE